MSQSAVVPEQVCRHQPFELPETVTCRSLAGMSSTGVVQRLRNTARRTCWVSVEQHRSPCRSSGVGACSCQRWADSRQPDTSVHCCIDTGRSGQRPYFRRYLSVCRQREISDDGLELNCWQRCAMRRGRTDHRVHESRSTSCLWASSCSVWVLCCEIITLSQPVENQHIKVNFKVKAKVMCVTCFQWSSVVWWHARHRTICTHDASRSESIFLDDIAYRSDGSTGPSYTCSRTHI